MKLKISCISSYLLITIFIKSFIEFRKHIIYALALMVFTHTLGINRKKENDI